MAQFLEIDREKGALGAEHHAARQLQEQQDDDRAGQKGAWRRRVFSRLFCVWGWVGHSSSSCSRLRQPSVRMPAASGSTWLACVTSYPPSGYASGIGM